MVEPFSERVSSREWREQAEGWCTAVLEGTGLTITGDFDQPRVRPWSTQLTVPTDAGLVWFKANCEPMAFEAALQTAVHVIAPWAVQEPLSIDADRGWMLTLDHGPSLGDSEPPTSDEWAGLLEEAGRLQRELLRHRDELLATGMPDCSPQTVIDRFDELRDQLRRYEPAHPGHLAADDDRRLAEVRPRLVEACERAQRSAWPVTWNHGDLHPWNAYRSDGRARLFDLGDGQWAHALEILAVPYDWIAEQGGIEWSQVMRPYLDGWGNGSISDETWRDMRVIRAVNRALTWAAWLDLTTADELARYGGEPEEHLLSVLDELGERERPRTLFASGA